MARRRRSSSLRLYIWAAAAFIAWAILVAAVQHRALVLVLSIGVGATLIARRRLRRREQERLAREREKLEEANRRAWRELEYEPGPYSVVVSGFENITAQEEVTDLFCDGVPVLRDQPVAEVEALIQRIAHIAPQPVIEGIAQHNAIHLKQALELRGARAKIKDTTKRSRGDGRREAIPASVRREVWNRDGGCCVDCGSRERLEYDHIIAVANGGSNTARNIELRCESCNRGKGAKI